MLPSPTDAATRLTGPNRTSPHAKMPGTLVSRRYGSRSSVQRPVAPQSGAAGAKHAAGGAGARWGGERRGAGGSHVGACEDEAARVERDLGWKPSSFGVGADEDEQPARGQTGGLARRGAANVDR